VNNLKNKIKSRFAFLIDQELILDGKSHIIEEVLKNEKIRIIYDSREVSENTSIIVFCTIEKIKKFSSIKNRLVVTNGLEIVESNKVVKCNFMVFEEVEQFIKCLFEGEKKILFIQKLKESEKSLDLVKELNELKEANEVNENILEFERFIDLEIELLKAESRDDWNFCFKNFIKKENWITQLNLIKLDVLLEDESIFDDNVLLFKIPSEDYFLHIRLKNTDLESISFNIELLIHTLLKSLQTLDQKLIRTDDEIDFWKKIFAKIPYPMSVISQLGDLLIYNERFAKIGILPKECLSYKDQETVEIDQQYFIVKRIEIEIMGQVVDYFVFYTAEKESGAGIGGHLKKGGVDDLGIVSSSIAHELNNPLAGILAALSVLTLEDNWSEDALSEIKDMQTGARRCKELVEIFLGFSRFSPNQNMICSLQGSMNQAINLLRFRMVESNLRIDMRYFSTLEKFAVNMNSSILSMILYLIMSELLTSFAHDRLIRQKLSSNLGGEVLELSNQIILRLDDEFEYEDKLSQAKLIQHLLIFEKMEMNFQKKEIRLIYRT
jgi:hypothetical protein